MENNVELIGIVSQLDKLIPQLGDFIAQFHNLLTQTGVNAITDAQGNMSIDVPQNMPDITANNISKKLGIIDRLINDHGGSINDLFKRGLDIEKGLKVSNSKYVSVFTEKIATFKKLNSTYKH
jgi:hypothetical protein